jgi:hypothetical protein
MFKFMQRFFAIKGNSVACNFLPDESGGARGTRFALQEQTFQATVVELAYICGKVHSAPVDL